MPSDQDGRAIGRSVRTVADLSDRDTSKLPEELQHSDILLFRDMSIDGVEPSRAYQIVFDQSWMPFSYTVPDGWQIIHAETEWHNTSESLLSGVLGIFGREDPCLKIVVNDRA